MQTNEGLTERIERLLANAEQAVQEARSYLISKGEVVDLAEWVRIKGYCQRFGIRNVETVLNWLDRGILPAENGRVIKEFTIPD